MDLNRIFVGDSSAERLIIFLHEGLGSVEQWKNFPEHVCRETHSYGLIYDRSGYGKSPGSLANRKPTYLHESAIELDALIEDLPNHYERILYGHSDGGSIALIYAANYPTKIKAIITEAAHVFVEPETLIGVQAALPLFKKGKFDGLKKYHGERFEEVFLAWNTAWLSPAFASWNIVDLLPKITCPQLVMQGIDDQYGTAKQVETISKLTKGVTKTVLIENCGHAPHKENENETLIVIEDFLNGIN